MSEKLKVVWYNGMNVDKVHFEQQERYFERNLNLKTISSFSNLYGVLDLEISSDLLLQGKIGLTKISCISQDGTIFNAPDQDELPVPLEISPSELNSAIIVLKLPISSGLVDISLQNNLPNLKFTAKQVLISSRVHDEASNDILSELDDKDDFELSSAFTQDKENLILASQRSSLGVFGSKMPYELSIPICKIKNIDLNKQITLDEKFIPTCIDISKNTFITNFIEELSFATKQHQESYFGLLGGVDQAKNRLDFSTYLTLNMLKKWHLMFSYLLKKDKFHPEYLYEKLVDFQADLLALSHDNSFSEFIAYDHNNLTQTFVPLINNLRLLFSHILSPKYIMAQIVKNNHGFYDCIFDNPSIIENSEIYFAIHSDTKNEYLLKNFKAQCKIHTQSNIKGIVSSQLRGINVEQISVVPSTLPKLNDYIYYKIDKKDEIFKSFANQNVISVYITANLPNADIKMWALL
ncbi:type VI secretion system baseplate subunit TssK [Campylobacter concisus]|uniref:type VI secretion system baseplate subunit TssK n=1 Tax=Campylobacter concisus TaxID=199 RepID=UPI000CD947B0|nr:type VI secretion system baseplate subunit TssK [Campylobacter concisus]